MILARAISADHSGELGLAFARLGLPGSAREYLLEKLPRFTVLLTGLSPVEGRFLRSRAEAMEAPGREEFPTYVSGDQKKRPGSGLLSGRKDQLERLREDAAAVPELAGLARALGVLLDAPEAPPPMVLGGKTLTFGARTLLMGVVNVTPDSFSDGGRFLAPDAAIAQGLALVEAGADLLDVGGESTRPGAPEVSEDEEWARVDPVLRGLRARTDVPLSIDTRKAGVARRALSVGASLVNDVSGLHHDPELARAVAAAGAACCLMHTQGTPETMQRDPRYGDVVEEILGSLAGSVTRAVEAGVARERIWIDPGIGFGKTFTQNHFLLRRLKDLRALGLPLLVGTSRKSFLGALTGGKPAPQRLAATLGSVAAVAVLGGADVVRVHDVAEARDALAVADAIRHARDGGELF